MLLLKSHYQLFQSITLPKSTFILMSKQTSIMPVQIESSHLGVLKDVLEVAVKDDPMYFNIYSHVEGPKVIINVNRLNIEKCFA